MMCALSMIPADVLVKIDSEVAVPSADGLVVAEGGIANYEDHCPRVGSHPPQPINNNNNNNNNNNDAR
jgi:hypothetical protein